MLDSAKTNSVLGQEIHKHLVANGVETPFAKDYDDSPGSVFPDKQYQKKFIEDHFSQIMKALHLDLSDDSLEQTPKRVARMFVDEIYWGMDYDNFPKITTVNNKMHYDEMIVEKNVKVHSNCEHHFVPIIGTAQVAYIPKDKVIGLSKINRIVEFFSRRPQIQERLTEQIYQALRYILKTEDIAVMIDAQHMCVMTRGVEDAGSNTISSKLGGAFKNKNTREEFLSIARG